MSSERLAELIKKAEQGILSQEEIREIDQKFKKAAMEWPEKKRQLDKFLAGNDDGSVHKVQGALLNEADQKEDHYKKLLRQREGRHICCGVCGENWHFEKLNMCKECGSVYCFRCVWDPTIKNKKRRCDCGGEID